MKKIFAMILACCVSFTCLAGCGSGAASSATANSSDSSVSGGGDDTVYTLRINSNMSDSDLVECADGAAIAQLIEEVEAKSGGRIKMDLYLNSQLGSGTDEILGGAENGAFECFNLNASNWASYTNAFTPLILPYMFTSQEILRAYLDGEGGRAIEAQILQDTGMKPMFYAFMGYRTIVNNVRPITCPDDMKGLKMRVLGNEYILEAFKLWGASTVSVSYSELYTATQQGLIDGSDGPYTDITTSNRNEVNKYISDIDYSYHVGVWAIAQSAYDALPADLQEIFDTACAHAQETAADNSSYSDAALSQLKETMTYNSITQEGMDAFQSSVAPLYETVKDTLGADAWNTILENIELAEASVSK